MTQPVPPISGAYPPPAIIARRDDVQPAVKAGSPAASASQVPAIRAAGQLPGIVLAGAGWVPVLHSHPRRGLRADEAERRRYRSSYAGSNAAPASAPRMERRV